MENNYLQERLFRFAIRTIKFLRTLPDAYDFKIIKYQLVKSSTSSGANYEEAQAGSSKADFHNKVKISLREMRESNYWFRIIEELKWLINKSLKLKKILDSIVQKTR